MAQHAISELWRSLCQHQVHHITKKKKAILIIGKNHVLKTNIQQMVGKKPTHVQADSSVTSVNLSN